MPLSDNDLKKNAELAQRPDMKEAIKHLDAAFNDIFYNADQDLTFEQIVALAEGRLQKVYNEWSP